ncbi:MAG: DUF2508 family protein [Lachnospiraceae bacterium]|nr:DUF2508 family protein [Lachnospiraceae bacterium]
MKSITHHKYNTSQLTQEDFTPVSIMDSIEKTRQALEFAYAGFDNATDADMIDSYIYEIIALQKRHAHLVSLAVAEKQPEEPVSYTHSPIRTLVSHVFG